VWIQHICIIFVVSKQQNMQNLFRYSNALIAEVSIDFTRYLYEEIKWDDRLIGITGARGIGKTTLMIQFIRKTYGVGTIALYVSLDHFYFQKNKLFDLAEEFYINGGRHLFIDEVHRYPNWSSELKNVFDNFPKLKVVFSGSSALQIHKAEADLSRRAVMYTLGSMSLREYVELTNKIKVGSWTLDEIIKNHMFIAQEIQQKIQPIPEFTEYLKGGVYPFFSESTAKFEQRLMSTVNVIIENDLMAIENFSYSTLIYVRRILAFIADSVPFKPNISELGRKTGVSRDILLKLIDLLEKSDLLILLKQNSVPRLFN
jgi:predicted AAA+ superfamily ATPase